MRTVAARNSIPGGPREKQFIGTLLRLERIFKKQKKNTQRFIHYTALPYTIVYFFFFFSVPVTRKRFCHRPTHLIYAHVGFWLLPVARPFRRVGDIEFPRRLFVDSGYETDRSAPATVAGDARNK